MDRAKYYAAIDAVNEATDRHEYDRANVMLCGIRKGLEICGYRWSGIDDDNYAMDKYSHLDGLELCCGTADFGVVAALKKQQIGIKSPV